MNQSIGLLKRLKYNVKFGPFTTDGAIDAIRPIVEIAYADQILELRDQRSTIVTYINPKTKLTYRLDNRRTVSQLLRYPPRRLAALITFTVRSNLHLINVGLDMSPPARVEDAVHRDLQFDLDLLNSVIEQPGQ